MTKLNYGLLYTVSSPCTAVYTRETNKHTKGSTYIRYYNTHAYEKPAVYNRKRIHASGRHENPSVVHIRTGLASSRPRSRTNRMHGGRAAAANGSGETKSPEKTTGY